MLNPRFKWRDYIQNSHCRIKCFAYCIYFSICVFIYCYDLHMSQVARAVCMHVDIVNGQLKDGHWSLLSWYICLHDTDPILCWIMVMYKNRYGHLSHKQLHTTLNTKYSTFYGSETKQAIVLSLISIDAQLSY